MRIRFVDVLLVVALFVVTAAIVWTMLNLGSSPIRSSGSPPTVSDDGSSASPSTRIQPLAPGEASPSTPASTDASRSSVVLEPDAGVLDTEPNATATNEDDDSTLVTSLTQDGSSIGDTSEASTEVTSVPAAGTPPDPTIPSTEAAAVPDSGPVALGRIGYSFVTGGSGACGIVLEPWTHVAVSRELLAAYGCGATVTLTLDDEVAGRAQATVIVADTMNEAWSRTVNVYVGQEEPALSYGLTTGSISPQ